MGTEVQVRFPPPKQKVSLEIVTFKPRPFRPPAMVMETSDVEIGTEINIRKNGKLLATIRIRGICGI